MQRSHRWFSFFRTLGSPFLLGTQQQCPPRMWRGIENVPPLLRFFGSRSFRVVRCQCDAGRQTAPVQRNKITLDLKQTFALEKSSSEPESSLAEVGIPSKNPQPFSTGETFCDQGDYSSRALSATHFVRTYLFVGSQNSLGFAMKNQCAQLVENRGSLCLFSA